MIDDPGSEDDRRAAAATAAHASPGRGETPSGERRQSADRARSCASARWAPARITRCFSITWASPRSTLGFGGEDREGIYHSIYDDFYWYTHFADTDFVYGRALAQTAGTAVMRLADAELLPFDFDNFTATIRRYVDEVERLANGGRARASSSAIGRSTKASSQPPTIRASPQCRRPKRPCRPS